MIIAIIVVLILLILVTVMLISAVYLFGLNKNYPKHSSHGSPKPTSPHSSPKDLPKPVPANLWSEYKKCDMKNFKKTCPQGIDPFIHLKVTPMTKFTLPNEHIKTPDLDGEDCIEKCFYENPNCTAVTYDHKNKKCYQFINQLVTSDDFTTNPDTTSGLFLYKK